ncbi:MAG: hypothetical protein ACOYN0_08570 [Phycisphaerales bacterium]
MRTALALTGLVTISALLGGCFGNSNYPAIAGASAATDSPNTPAVESCMTLAVRWVADRYPPRNDRREAQTPKEAGDITVRWPMVLNLPVGTRKVFYERIARNCGPEVRPMTTETENNGAPVYHVGRVWVRAHEAKVDVYRPMPEIDESPGGGGRVYQMITVTLKGGFEPWRVVHGRAWEPGAHELPEIYYMPEVDREDQFRHEMRLRREAREAGFVEHPAAEPSPQPAPAPAEGESE